MTDASSKRRRLWHDTRGFTAVFLALTLSVLIGFSALGVETGLWYLIKRVNQSAADVAALSGAMEVVAGKPYQTDICPLAKLGAEANNFTVAAGWTCPASSPPNTSDCTSLTSGQMCVNNPPLFPVLGAAGTSDMVEVILAQQQDGFLASLWQANVMINTRAVAGPKAFDTCMIALGPSGTDLKNNGNATVTLNNCSFASNSVTDTNPDYSVKFNGGVTMTAAAISTAGGAKITGSSNFISPPITTHAAAVPDPYLGAITVPSLGAITVPSPGPPPFCKSFTASADVNVLTPGLYGGACAGGSIPVISITGGTTTLCSGVYVLDGDDNQGEAFVIRSNATVNMGIPGTTYPTKTGAVTGSVLCPTQQFISGTPYTIPFGITVITTCSASNCGGGFIVGDTGSPTVTLAAPTTTALGGTIPARILFYQVAFPKADPGPGHPGNTTLAGGSLVSLNGVVYTPSTEIALQGNPTFDSCTELIANDFVIGGNPVMYAPLTTCGINTKSVSTLVLLE